MSAIDTRGRGFAMAACMLAGTLVLADGESKGRPTDLEWLRAEVGDGGFDNHRWASHHPDYMVVTDEVDEESKGVTYPVVMRADGSRGARLGNKGLARNKVYGDFAVGDGVGQGWLAP